jgi:hypothetical protein
MTIDNMSQGVITYYEAKNFLSSGMPGVRLKGSERLF